MKNKTYRQLAEKMMYSLPAERLDNDVIEGVYLFARYLDKRELKKGWVEQCKHGNEIGECPMKCHMPPFKYHLMKKKFDKSHLLTSNLCMYQV